MLALRLPAAIENRLRILAERTGRTKSYYAREAILRHIEEIEDAYLAAQRLERPARRWTLTELKKDSDRRPARKRRSRQ